MRTIPIDDWKKISVQERNEILKEANAKPSLFRLFIQVILKWLEEPKPPPLLSTKIFGYKDSYIWRQRHGR